MRVWLASSIAVVLGLTSTARAQPVAERPARETTMAPPQNALELSLGTGYTQGFGSLQSGVGMPSVATYGLGVDLGIGYRVNPRWGVLWSGQYQDLTSERADAARAFTSSLAAQFHYAPEARLDPWLEVGAGYRFLWEDPGAAPTLLTHGIELARVRLGLDYRADGAVAIGPVIGADATMFLFQNVGSTEGSIADPRLSTFVFAGVQGRLDIGGRASPTPRTTAGR